MGVSTLVRSPAVKWASLWCVSATILAARAWFVRAGSYAFEYVSDPVADVLAADREWAGTLDRATAAILCLVKAHGWPVVTGRADREQGQAHLPAEQPQAGQDPRLPEADAHQGGPRHRGRPAPQGS